MEIRVAETSGRLEGLADSCDETVREKERDTEREREQKEEGRDML
jgi:hypothetical protein